MKRILLLSIITLAFSNLQAQNKQELSKLNIQSQQHGFIENKGQIHDQNYKANPTVKYLLSIGNGLNVQLKSNSFSYDTYKTEVNERKKDSLQALMHPKEQIAQDVTFYFHRVDVELLGAKENPTIIVEEPSADYLNYYNAVTPEEGATMVRSYKKVTYKNIYNGIDLEFVAQASKAKPVEYNFIVHPGADAKQIQIKYNGANQTNLKEEKINIEVAHGTFSESIPASWLQESKQKLNISYKSIGANTYGFNIPNYNSNQTLIIDPNPDLVWATYYGGSSGDCLFSVIYDEYENIICTGPTLSSNAIASFGSYQSSFLGNTDIFIVKISSNGIRLWGTYYGGSGDNRSFSLAIDLNGNIFLTGMTSLDSVMVTSGSYQSIYGGGTHDILISKFNTNGFRNWGSYFGGNGKDMGRVLNFDNFGNIIVGGNTLSSNNIATLNAYQTTNNGGIIDGDAVIAKFSAAGNCIWSTYFGGSNDEKVTDICSDSTNNIYIIGSTNSTNSISTQNSHQEIIGGQLDAFVSKFDSTGNKIWATYFGGEGNDEGNSIDMDCNANIIICGKTYSNTNIASPNSYQTTLNGGQDVFFAKLSSIGNLIYSTYYGGEKGEYPNQLTVNLDGSFVFVGQTTSLTNIANSSAYQNNFGGINDGFITKFDKKGDFVWGTYYGGEGFDEIYDVKTDSNSNVYIVGWTKSTTNMASDSSFQINYGGGYSDAFIAKFSYCNKPAAPIIQLVGNDLQSSASTANQWYNQNGLIVGATAQTYTPTLDGDYFVIVADGECLSDTSNIINIVNAGILATEPSNSIKISPNPVRSQLLIENIDVKTPISFEVYNATGNLMYKNNLQEKTMINTSNWANGVYIIKLENGNRYKFVKD